MLDQTLNRLLLGDGGTDLLNSQFTRPYESYQNKYKYDQEKNLKYKYDQKNKFHPHVINSCVRPSFK